MPKIAYTSLPSPHGHINKPLINIGLSSDKTHRVIPAQIKALIDSGADVCLCSEDISAWLGIKLNRKKSCSFTAANNQIFNAIPEYLTMSVFGKKYKSNFFISNNLPKNFPIILGQKGFFSQFKIVFDYKNLEIEIT
ncbi:MAG: hypothetical protein UT63_C0028G0002 [Candidatus Gottesmanbacteria bacterium GW2011_GWC2_39_8]|uniref:Peptidase A2 domain-containing protein n=1 Tax=Candidatus Gottesmanbacteria bacterium GW2011_GWC2_39_8 TaxID=1618450 RepID=A0A0G0PYD4_9BACT|nr:MAG: hypothetical protein UT63_C0028G0002 [Candidatus Gottesmanbacteria bacterium GW2011_GWC2_39_8]